MRLETVLLGRAETDMRAHQDQRRPRGVGAGGVQRGADRIHVVAVGHVDDLPAIRLEALRAILGEGDVGTGGERDVVVVIQADQLAEFQMPGQRSRFAGDTFHQVTVADDGPGAVVDHLVAVAVVARGQMRLADRHADRVRQTLAERPGGHFDTGRVAVFGMSGRLAAPLAELLQVIQRQRVTGHVQQAVQQRRAVAGGQHEAVAVRPVRIRRVMLQLFRPQRVCHRRGAERQTGVAAVGLLHHVHRQEAKRVDALLIERAGHGGSFDDVGGRPCSGERGVDDLLSFG